MLKQSLNIISNWRTHKYLKMYKFQLTFCVTMLISISKSTTSSFITSGKILFPLLRTQKELCRHNQYNMIQLIQVNMLLQLEKIMHQRLLTYMTLIFSALMIHFKMTILLTIYGEPQEVSQETKSWYVVVEYQVLIMIQYQVLIIAKYLTAIILKK